MTALTTLASEQQEESSRTTCRLPRILHLQVIQTAVCAITNGKDITVKFRATPEQPSSSPYGHQCCNQRQAQRHTTTELHKGVHLTVDELSLAHQSDIQCASMKELHELLPVSVGMQHVHRVCESGITTLLAATSDEVLAGTRGLLLPN